MTTDTSNAVKQTKEVVDYSVEDILEQVSVLVSGKVWKHSGIRHKVSGVVEKVNIWKNRYSYFELTDANSYKSITCRCPANMSPIAGQAIIFEGTAHVKPSNFHTGFELMVIGKPIGTWSPLDPEMVQTLIPSKVGKIPLIEWIQRYPIQNMHMIGTTTGIDDAISHAGIYGEYIKKHIVTVSDKFTLIKSISSIVNTSGNLAGLIFVRGGDDLTVNIWDDQELISYLMETKIPFYSAIGHTHRVCLIDKYSDQAFNTPTAVGHEISAASRQINNIISQNKKINAMRIQRNVAFYSALALLLYFIYSNFNSIKNSLLSLL